MTTELRDQLQATLGSAYTLDRELGGGGMSRVFVADEAALDRKVVVKVLRPDLAEGISADRFRREILLAASLQQANIVPVLSAGVSDGLPFYTMPFVEGESLRVTLAREGARPISEVVKVMGDVARALAYAHQRGVVHRDIKPDNVLLSGGTAVVTDFGIAKALSAARAEQPGATLTSVGTSIGTPAYMAPEQAAGDPNTDHRADLYALGVMAYELLAGQTPFHGLAPQKMLAAQMSQIPAPVRDRRPECPPALASLVSRLLEKEPSLRPQTATEVLQALEAVATTSPSGGGFDALPAISIATRRALTRALLIYAAAFVLVALLAKAAIVGIGLPDWVFPAALVVMALGLPAILFTAFVHHSSRVARTMAVVDSTGSNTTSSTMTRIAVKASPHVSWRRAAIGGVAAVTVLVLLVAGYMTMRALGIGPAGSLLAAGALNNRDRVLVADFKVSGADSALAGVLAQAMRTNLEQSRVLNIVSTGVVGGALQRMQRPADSRVDLTLAREIAQREGIKAVVAGEATPVGGGYLLSARLVGASSGDELASFQETADGVRDLIPALDRLARKLRGKVGESLKAVHADPPLEQVTTTSLEALKKFVAASDEIDHGGDLKHAIGTLKEAIALDSTFAMAWRKLSIAYGNGAYPPDVIDDAKRRTYRLRDHLTEPERLLATANYFIGPGHDRMKAIEAYRSILKLAPETGPALTNLAQQEAILGNYAAAESLYHRRSAMPSATVAAIEGLIRVLISEGKRREADSVLTMFRARFPAQSRSGTVALLWQDRQFDSVMTLTELGRRQSNLAERSGWLSLRRDLLIMRGRLAEARRTQSELSHVDSARGAPVPAMIDSLRVAWTDIWYRDARARGVATLDATLARTPLRSLPFVNRPYFEDGVPLRPRRQAGSRASDTGRVQTGRRYRNATRSAAADPRCPLGDRDRRGPAARRDRRDTTGDNDAGGSDGGL